MLTFPDLTGLQKREDSERYLYYHSRLNHVPLSHCVRCCTQTEEKDGFSLSVTVTAEKSAAN